jgi:heme-degrading monooxygenase HmoA
VEVVEDRLVPDEALEAHDLLREERPVVAELNVALAREAPEPLVRGHGRRISSVRTNRLNGGGVIARIWHGWAVGDDADAYEALVRDEILPGIHRIDGFLGFDLLRVDETDGEVEFVTVTFFESLDAVRAFAGEDYEAAVVPPEARRHLTRFDERVRHYRLVASTR